MTVEKTADPPAIEAATFDRRQAERFTNCSGKTLDRAAAVGERVGRIKVGRKVLFIRSELEAWLRSKLVASAN